MASCPLCHTPVPVNHDFGLYECVVCSAQLIVHMDGRVEHSGAQVAIESEPDKDSDPIAPDQTGQVPAAVEFEFPEPYREIEMPTQAKVQLESVDEDPVLQFAEPEVSESRAREAEFNSQPMSFREVPRTNSHLDATEQLVVPINYGQPLDHQDENREEEQEPKDSAPSPDEDYQSIFAEVSSKPEKAPLEPMEEVAQFANSTDSGASAAGLRYHVMISGIDTVDIRTHFREAITDVKFRWDTDEILRNIKNGEIRLENLSAVKAHLLVTRLRELPLEISWEQNAIHQS